MPRWVLVFAAAVMLAVGLGFASLPGSAFTPNDPSFSLQWAYPKIEATRAWDLELGSSSIVVAVLDTGMDLFHPDLTNRLWKNPGEIPGNGLDDDANGKIDDVNGWDFVSNDNDPQDEHFHGTHVSGIAAAETHNAVGVAGTAQVSIMVLRVFPAVVNGMASPIEENVLRALDYAVEKGARVISMSFGLGSTCTSAVEQQLQDAWAAGLVLVAGTGNDNSDAILCPANHLRVIPVGATAQDDSRWVGSNYGDHLRDNGLVAPGKDIYSTFLGVSAYGYLTGTSMAAPFVAGVAALVLSHNPTLSNQQVKTILLRSADDLGDLGPDIFYGYGRLNALRAVLGSEDRPYVKMTTPGGGGPTPTPDPRFSLDGTVSSSFVYVAGYVRNSAQTPTRAVQRVLVDISNKGCGIMPNWREAGLDLVTQDWQIAYDVTGYPPCEYWVSARAWDGIQWSNMWSVTIQLDGTIVVG